MKEKAIVTCIELGVVEFDGLMIPDGQYAIAVSQIADTMTQEQQEIIYDFERMAKRRAVQHPHVCPDELVLKALDTF